MAGALIAGTGSLSTQVQGDDEDRPLGEVFAPGTVARAELYIWGGSLAWLIFVGAAVKGL